ncbi:MAG: hypothetical protein IJ316_03790 [Clostridia bacterium]|nr:hypothetical protein [Clostridia bacterium]
MNILKKGTVFALCATTLLSTTAFAKEAVLPVRETLEEKGYEVNWVQETKTVVISDGGFVVEEAVGDTISLNYDTTYAHESFFTNIDEQRKAYEEYSTKATVKELGEGYFLADTEKLGEVMFRYDDKTHFHHETNRMLYKANDLAVGSSLKVYFDQAMTASIPPQVYAIEVVFLNSEGKLAVNENSQVFTVTEKGEGYILATNEKMGEVMFKVDENTSFRHEMNRRLYRLEDVEVGSNLQITFADAMTASIPPQVYASDIVFVASAESSEKLTTKATVTEIGDDYILAESEKLGEVKFMVDENTLIRSEKNKMLYMLSDVIVGLEVTVFYADAMTMSLPPQVYAYEVVLPAVVDAPLGELTTAGKITEIGEGYFVIEGENGEVRFNVSDETFYHHTMNRMLYVFESLEVGMEVEVKHLDAATFSLPPQMSAIEVIIK